MDLKHLIIFFTLLSCYDHYAVAMMEQVDGAHDATSGEQQEAQHAHLLQSLELRSGAPREEHLSTSDAAGAEAPVRLIDILLSNFELYLAKRHVLSLDGGGVRGAFTARILQRIEEETGKSIRDIFQGSITGTSTGSFIALGLVSPDKGNLLGAGPYSATEIVAFYKGRAAHMFSGCWARDNCVHALKCPSSTVGRIGCVFKNICSCFGCFGCCYNCSGVCGPKYTRKALDTELAKLLGTTRQLKEALGPVQVTTYDMSQGGGILHLSSTDSRTNQYRFCEAAAASSAAPTYFPAALVGDDGSATHRRVCVDGGLFENNPILPAVAQAQSVIGDGIEIADFTVVSVGTGQAAGAFHDKGLQYAGALSWAKPAIDIGMDGTSMAAHSSFSSIFRGGYYFRMQASLAGSLLEMDNTEEENIIGLIKEADTFCNREESTFHTFLLRLKQEDEFATNIRRVYGTLPDEIFQREVFRRFQDLVGTTHEETKENIEQLSSNQLPPTEFKMNVLHYFNDLRLLRALKASIIVTSKRFSSH